jgi:aspartate racemase
MKTIGLLGGMSWESTLSYYQLINRGVNAALGKLHSARIILNSVDFNEIEVLQHSGDWAGAAKLLEQSALRVETAGADCLLICTNTMHKVADEIASAIGIPLLHIADATAAKLLLARHSKVGLLGTRFTMEEDFYKGRLCRNFGIEVIVPDKEQRDSLHGIIYQELCLGRILETSRKIVLELIDSLRQQDAQAVILGCTEIALLVNQTHTSVPLFDTTQIHADAAVSFALNRF